MGVLSAIPSNVVSRESVRIIFLIVTLNVNDLQILGAEIGNECLNAPKNQAWNSLVIMIRALYDLKSAGVASVLSDKNCFFLIQIHG